MPRPVAAYLGFLDLREILRKFAAKANCFHGKATESGLGWL